MSFFQKAKSFGKNIAEKVKEKLHIGDDQPSTEEKASAEAGPSEATPAAGSKPVLVTLGSSGNVGKAAIVALAGVEGLTLKVGVRDPSKLGPDAVPDGASVVAADMSKPETLAEALKGADYVYVITPGAKDRTQHGINSVDAAKAAGLKHIVLVSVLSADETGTIFADQFTPLEAHLAESGVPYTILQLPLFTDNNFGNIGSIKEQGSIYGAGKPDAPFVSIAVADVASAAAAIFKDPAKHAGKKYKLTSKPYTNEELAKIFSGALDKEVKYVQVPFEAAKGAIQGAGLEEWQADGILELIKMIDEGKPVLVTYSEDYTTITGKEPTSIEAWVSSVAPAFK